MSFIKYWDMVLPLLLEHVSLPLLAHYPTISNWTKGDICWQPSAFQPFLFHLLFVGNSEHSSLWFHKRRRRLQVHTWSSFSVCLASCLLEECLLYACMQRLKKNHLLSSEAPSTSSFRNSMNFVIQLSGIPSFSAWISRCRQMSAGKARNIPGAYTCP